MKEIMTEWRKYQAQTRNDHEFELIIESATNNNSDTEQLIDEWLAGQEKILHEIDLGATMAKGKQWIDEKINNFLINLYFKAANLVSKLVEVGLVVFGPVIKILNFIGVKISSFLRKYPLVARIALTMFLVIALLCASAIINTAMAGEPDPAMNKYVDILQGILTDRLTDISHIEGSQDLISTELSDPALKAKYADAISHLETLKGDLVDINDFKKVKGDNGRIIKNALDMMVDMYKDPPGDMTRDDVQTALSKWRIAGEKIKSVYYRFFEQTSAMGSTSRETLKIIEP